MKATAAMVLFLIFAVLCVCFEMYKFHDCKKIGHGTLYCVMKIGD